MKVIRTYPVDCESAIEMPTPLEFLSISAHPEQPDTWLLSAMVMPETPLMLVRTISYPDNEPLAHDIDKWIYLGTSGNPRRHFYARCMEWRNSGR